MVVKIGVALLKMQPVQVTQTADGNDIAAVLGVVSGSVKISYRDSDGDNNSIEIQIDTVPPVVELRRSRLTAISSKDDRARRVRRIHRRKLRFACRFVQALRGQP